MLNITDKMVYVILYEIISPLKNKRLNSTKKKKKYVTLYIPYNVNLGSCILFVIYLIIYAYKTYVTDYNDHSLNKRLVTDLYILFQNISLH